MSAATVFVWGLAVAGGLFASSWLTLWLGVVGMSIRRELWARRNGHPAVVGLFRWLWAGARETTAQFRVISWAIVRRGSHRTSPGSGRPVVLVHGLAADGTSMSAFRGALERVGRPTSAPFLGRILRPVEAYAERLTPALAEAIALHPDEDGVDVVCHSLGAIALRVCLAHRPDLAARIRNVVAIGAPHQGTVGARGLPGIEARQLAHGTPWLASLPSLLSLLPNSRVTTICSRHDEVVYPHTTSILPGAVTHELDHIGHTELLVSRQVIDLVVAAVA